MRKFLAATVVAGLIVPALAQPSAPTDKEETASAAPKQFLLDVSDARAKSGRVPNGYGQIGLTRDQRERIYGIQAAYAERIRELEREVEMLKEEQMVQIKNVLTDVQKSQIERYEQQVRARRAAN